jgi:ribonuclease Z
MIQKDSPTMTKLILLGTGHAISSLERDNTHMALVGRERMVLIDTATNPVLRLRQAGLDLKNLTDVILTHFHPDHVSGVPILLLDSWLMKRTQPLNIYGLSFTLDRVEQMMSLFGWEEWPNFFPVNFIRVPADEMAAVLQCAEFSIYSSPVRHMIPNMGLRIELAGAHQVIVYSCDTQPAPEVERLASGASLLLHEATGAANGHSSAAQAGTIARQAAVGKLVLIHLDPEKDDPKQLIEQAKSTYPGPVELAQDFMEFEF